MLAVAFASGLLVFMLSFQFGTYEQMINASVKLSTGHLQIMAENYNEKKQVRMVVSDPEKITEILSKNPHVKSYTERSEAFVIAESDGRSGGVMLMGIDAKREKDVSEIDQRIAEGGYLTSGSAVVGHLLAEKLKLKVGSEVTVLGQGRDGSVAALILTVAGIFKTGFEDYDRNVMMMNIDEFDSAFYMNGAVHRVVVMADSSENIFKIKAGLNSDGLDVLSWSELSPGIKQSIELDLVSGLIMYAILIVVVAFSIINTFFMAVFERTKEFGVLMSIGTPPKRLIIIMLYESFFITLAGLLTGIIFGVLVTWHFASAGIYMQGMELMEQYGLSGALYPKLSIVSLVLGPAVVALVTIFSSLFPALRIIRLKPADALKGV